MLAACGRVGFDLDAGAGTSSEGQTSGDGGATNTDGGALAGGGGSGNSSGTGSGGATSSGGAIGSGGATSTGGGTGTGGMQSTGGSAASDGGPGNGGATASGGAIGVGGSSGAGGAVATGGAGGCAPTNGGIEICDGRDNDCSGTVDDRGACPSVCEGAAYGGHGYMLCGGTSNWDQARAGCQAQGMDLAVIGSAEENQFLFDWISKNRRQAFIGGTDVTTEGDWRWVDGTPFWSGAASGSPVDSAYNNWVPGQPDNAASATYEGDCLYMSWGESGRWQDWWCLQALDYVCETP
jgi:hypothetical protein